ncbi:hypothetical protein OEA41_007147 [Lepraria neglecta]|uniref:3'-5' exonuclease domain-containing protein n=1 Tax=Lepraria neglecta TaxID=209136 RepID=A0AAE0DLI1_9LECA|nr:hypothetical protein OEA41_007147 [Lepraria neglecta]
MRDIKTEIINTTKQIGDLVDWLVFRYAPPVPYSLTMYIDLEGVNLCREGSISILTLLIDTGIPTRRVCLIDMHVLGAQAFNTTGVRQKTLKDILQDEMIAKVFFDVRNDSDALFAHFGVELQGVEDVQLMESATRRTTQSRKFLSSLAKCVENNLLMSFGGSGLASWKLAKEKGERLFKSEHGGSYECLPELRDRFWGTRAFRWRDLVKEESKKRVAASQRSEYQPHGRDRAIASWSEDQNRTLDQWNYVPPPRDYFDEDFDPYDDQAERDWYDDRDDNDYEDWTRAPWQGPPS